MSFLGALSLLISIVFSLLPFKLSPSRCFHTSLEQLQQYRKHLRVDFGFAALFEKALSVDVSAGIGQRRWFSGY